MQFIYEFLTFLGVIFFINFCSLVDKIKIFPFFEYKEIMSFLLYINLISISSISLFNSDKDFISDTSYICFFFL